MKFYDKLCKPAQLYLLISLVVYVIILIQNIASPDRFTLGPYSCMHDNQPIVMVGQLIYIAFWTWLLNMICKINTGISWLIVLFPFILFFVVFLAVVFNGREGMDVNTMSEEDEEEKDAMTNKEGMMGKTKEGMKGKTKEGMMGMMGKEGYRGRRR